jgi:hypothetical protein
MSDSGVVERCEKKAEARVIKDFARLERAEVEAGAKRFEHVGGTAFRSEGSVAVLDDREAAGRCNESGRGRNVDGAGEVAASAAAVGEHVGRSREVSRSIAKSKRCAGELFGGLAFHSQGHESRGHQGLAERALDDPVEEGPRVAAIDIASVKEAGNRRFDASVPGPGLGASL